jgi:hypothetical protein
MRMDNTVYCFEIKLFVKFLKLFFKPMAFCENSYGQFSNQPRPSTRSGGWREFKGDNVTRCIFF